MNKQDSVVISLVYILGIVWVVININSDINIILCPTKVLFGIPCPGCGITRSLKFCFDGAWGDAIKMNPNIILVWIIAPIAPVLLIIKFMTKIDYVGKVNALLNNRIFLSVFGIVESVIWTYNIIRNI